MSNELSVDPISFLDPADFGLRKGFRFRSTRKIHYVEIGTWPAVKDKNKYVSKPSADKNSANQTKD